MLKGPSSAATLFHSYFTKAYFEKLFEEYFSDSGGVGGVGGVGRDGVRASAFEKNLNWEIDTLVRKIQSETFQFTSYKEKLISKGANSPPRQISIPTVRDKLVLKFLSELLAKVYPGNVSKPPHEFVKNIHEISSKSPADHFFLRLDIESYYPTINHTILLRILRRKIRQKTLLRLIENAIKTPTGKKKSEQTLNTVGIPQGLSISNILASIYLDDIDQIMSKKEDINYFRFVDDILIVCDKEKSKDLSVDLPKMIRLKRKIKCHKVGDGEKSKIIPVNKGIDYLGYHFCGDKIEIRSSSYKKMFSNLMKIFTSMKYQSNKAPLIWRLNLRITGCKYLDKKIGWLFFFSQSKNKNQLMQLDTFVKSQASNVLTSEQEGRLKSFIKAFHEIKYKYRTSKYFPDFDNFTDEHKKSELKILLPKRKSSRLDALTSKELDKLFQKCISREVKDIEKDMLEAFS